MIEWDRGSIHCYREDTGRPATHTARRVAVIYLDAQCGRGRTGWQESKKLLPVEHECTADFFQRKAFKAMPDLSATGKSAETLPGCPGLCALCPPFS